MALKDFKTIESSDLELMKVQENLLTYFRQLNPVTLSGLYLKTIQSSGSAIDITIGTSTTNVPHGLGRQFQGWHLLDLQGDARVWRDTTSTADGTRFLPLKASTSVKVSLWVF